MDSQLYLKYNCEKLYKYLYINYNENDTSNYKEIQSYIIKESKYFSKKQIDNIIIFKVDKMNLDNDFHLSFFRLWIERFINNYRKTRNYNNAIIY